MLLGMHGPSLGALVWSEHWCTSEDQVVTYVHGSSGGALVWSQWWRAYTVSVVVR